MKKTIAAILIMAIAAFSCFAVDAVDKQIKLNATVSYEDTNSFSMVLVASTEQGGPYSESDVTDLNLKAPGTVYFKVLDSSSYNSTAEAVYTVSIAVTPFENAHHDQMAVALNALTTKPVDNLSYSELADNSFVVTYAAYKSIIHSNVEVEIANFNASWEGDANIPAGDYVSTVTLSYVAP